MRCRFLCDLHCRWPQARGSIRNVETKPRCITDLVRVTIDKHFIVAIADAKQGFKSSKQ